MAEIRHTFQGGKMNKDLDERIVPQGEYRDALNVEVRTSSDSDIGAIQNLYGTKGRVSFSLNRGDVNPTVNWMGVTSSHIGSIANEKTNKAYFFIASPNHNKSGDVGFSTDMITSTKLYKDMIVEYDNVSRGIKPIAVDVKRVETLVSSLGTVTDEDGNENGHNSNQYRYITITTNDDSILKNIRIGMTFQIYNGDQKRLSTFDPQWMGGFNGLSNTPKILKIVDNGSTKEIHFDRYIVGNFETTHYCVIEAEPALNFSNATRSYEDGSIKSYITGINIIDNLLFWTDNETEPKKINIDRSIEGTNHFDYHTNLMINDPDQNEPTLKNLSLVDPGTDGGIIENHITVIKRAPRTSPKLEMSEYEGGINDSQISNLIPYSEDIQLQDIVAEQFTVDFMPNGVLYQPEDEIQIVINEGHQYSQGDRLEIYKGEFKIVVVVLDNPYNPPGYHFYNVKIEIIDSSITSDFLDWQVRPWEFKADPYFQLKFGRFSFRYKYQDGEYSSFAPWSEPAFIPGNFDYIPKKGYNLGMVNKVRMLKITDFIVDDALRPDDVTEVDILYKDTVSPNVYIVKTIKRSKNHEWQDSIPGTYSGVFEIKSEMIHRTLESSQTLRAWDNVPRKALAQEVTGNRLVYGNYLQNYDVYSPVFVKQWYESTPNISTNGDLVPMKSLKSIRKYRVGVVFGDKYGRETPVLGLGGQDVVGPGTPLKPPIHPDSVEVPKEKCADVNKLKAQLVWKNTLPEDWMEYYKFYVKETTNEYYNLVQDRWYAAEDGNVWVSFQSADRNKVDIETYLVLKNEHGTEEPVLDKARYKILAIKNEAPDFIKTTDKILGCIPMESNTNLTQSMIVNFDPGLYSSTFANVEFKGIGWGRLRAIEGDALKYSNWVKIARMNDTNSTVTLIDPFGDSADFAGALGVSSFQEIDEYEFEIKDAVVENRPEFDGKFFVKLYRDALLSTKIMDTTDDGLTYNTVFQLKFAYLANERSNTFPSTTSTFKGDFSAVSTPVAGSSDAQGGGLNSLGLRWMSDYNLNNDGYDSWSFSDDLNGDFARCDQSVGGDQSRDLTHRFWDWYVSPQNLKTRNYVYIDHIVGSARDGSSSIEHQQNPEYEHPGLYCNHDAEAPDTGGDYNCIQWGAVGKSAFSSNHSTFYQKMSDEGTYFRFSSDPNKILYRVAGTKQPWGGWNYHKKTMWSCKECDDDQSNCRRQMFRVYFHRKGDTSSGLDPAVWDPRTSLRHDGTTTGTIEIVEAHFDRSESVEVYTGNAIWETEPKEDVGMDLYYEASDAIPTYLKHENIQSFIPLGSKVVAKRNGVQIEFNPSSILGEPRVCSAVKDVISIGGDNCTVKQGYGLDKGDVLEFTHADGTVTSTVIIDHWYHYTDYSNSRYQPSDIWAPNQGDQVIKNETGYYRLEHRLYNKPIRLSWFNCYSFGNGLESDRIRDDYNAPTLDNGVKVSTTLDTFGEEHRASGMIWSGIYNSTSGVNSLNEFNMAQPITKDLNPSYGSLQALKTRDTNVVAFCEDKVFKILANKDALYNADGSSNITASNAVLGDATAFSGDYGISSNPESLAVDSYRMYFTDKQRNKVLRLSQDGLTPISDAGMSSWFRDNLRTTKHLIGTFDEIKGEYNLSLIKLGDGSLSDITVSFNEKTKGWTSFKSFVPETGLSINDEYLTGKIKYDSTNANHINHKVVWSHHNEDLSADGSLKVEANNFYGEHYNSTVDVLFNQSPEVVKSFMSMSYEGTQAKVDGWNDKSLTDANGNEVNINNPSYQDLTNDTKDGWYVSSFKTNLQEASIPEFIEREGKWFEYIKGDETTLSNLDTKEFSVQGVGVIDIASVPIIKAFKLTITENGE